MSIDIERLKVDPDYWDEVAPEGATHIHVYPDGNSQWMKINLSGAFNFYWHSRFSEWQRRETPSFGDAIARPNKLSAQEWDGTGLPPIGIRCEFRYSDSTWQGRTCRVIAFDADNDRCWLHLDNNKASNIYILSMFEFRPLRTKEQIEREEVIKAALDACSFPQGIGTKLTIEELYDAGMLRRPEK